jgi:hypothetical protein
MDSEPVDPMSGDPEVPTGAEAPPDPDAAAEETPEAEPAGTGGDSGSGASAALLPGPSGEDRAWAMMAHLLGAAGYLVGFGLAGWVGPLVLWVKCRGRSRFVAFHALQSFLFQIFAGVILFICWRIAVLEQDLIYLLWFAGAVPAVWAAAAAIRTFHGLNFEYPVVGGWALELTDDKS